MSLVRISQYVFVIYFIAGFAEAADSTAEEIKEINRCVLRSICNREMTQYKNQSELDAISFSGNQIAEECKKKLSATVAVQVRATKLLKEDKLLDYNLMYISNSSLKVVKNVMTCQSFSFLQSTDCKPGTDNLKAIAAVAEVPIQVRSFDDVNCRVDGDVSFKEYGFGFQKEGVQCKRICPSGYYLNHTVQALSEERYWKSKLEFDETTDDTQIGAGDVKCEKCASGITREKTNECYAHKKDVCGVGTELVTLPAADSNYNMDGVEVSESTSETTECRPKCSSGSKRNENGFCVITDEMIKKMKIDEIAALQKWDPEKELGDQYFANCSSADIVKTAKEYKEWRLKELKNDDPEAQYTIGTTFGGYFFSNGPEKCRPTHYSPKKRGLVVNKIDSSRVSQDLLKQFSGPYKTPTFETGFSD